MKNRKTNKILHIGLWLTQIFVALIMLWGGYIKFFLPKEELNQMMPWTAELPLLVSITGIVDILGGLGLILPALLRIKPKLTIYAAYGTAALMIAGFIFHVLRGETAYVGINVVLFLMAIFIAWGRSRKAPILSKN